MPNTGISISKFRQLIGLQMSNRSVREIARALSMSVGAVSRYLSAIRARGVAGAESDRPTDGEFARRLFGGRRRHRRASRHCCRRTLGQLATDSGGRRAHLDLDRGPPNG